MQLAIELVCTWGMQDHLYSQTFALASSYLESAADDFATAQFLVELAMVMGNKVYATMELERLLAWDPTSTRCQELYIRLKNES